MGTRLETLYWLPVITEGAEPQEGGGSVWACIANQKVYLTTPMPSDGVRVRGDSAGCRSRFIKILGFLLIIFQKAPQKNKKPPNINNNTKYSDFMNFIFY